MWCARSSCVGGGSAADLRGLIVFDWIADGFDYLFAKLDAIWQWFADVVVDFFTALWDVVVDAVSYLFEQVLSLAVAAANGLNLSGITANFGAFSSLPSGMLEVIQATGVGAALAVVAVALGIRFVLQLIPFVRLGS
jgi:hypothetical protein